MGNQFNYIGKILIMAAWTCLKYIAFTVLAYWIILNLILFFLVDDCKKTMRDWEYFIPGGRVACWVKGIAP